MNFSNPYYGFPINLGILKILKIFEKKHLYKWGIISYRYLRIFNVKVSNNFLLFLMRNEPFVEEETAM